MDSLPPELLYNICDHLEYASDVNVFSQTCRYVHRAAQPHLDRVYGRKYSPRGVLRIIKNDNGDVIRKLLSVNGNLDSHLIAIWYVLPIERAAQGKVNAFQALADAYASRNEELPGPTGLWDSAIDGPYIGIIKILDSVKVPTGDHVERLHSAARYGRLGSVKYFAEAGFPIDTRDDAGWTPLMYAAMEGNLDVMKLLLAAGADPNAQAQCNPNALVLKPLDLALQHGEEFAQALFDYGASSELHWDNDRAVCELARLAQRSEKGVLKLVLDRLDLDAIFEDMTEQRWEDLCYAAAVIGDCSFVERLLTPGCPPDMMVGHRDGLWAHVPDDHEHGLFDCGPSDDDWGSAASLAARHGHFAIMKDILAYEARLVPDGLQFCEPSFYLEKCGQHGSAYVAAVLDLAAETGDQDEVMLDALRPTLVGRPGKYRHVCQVLVDRGVIDSAIRTGRGRKILLSALWNGLPAVVSEIMDRLHLRPGDLIGDLSEVLTGDYGGLSILEAAAAYGSPEMVRAVLRDETLRPSHLDHGMALACAARRQKPWSFSLIMDLTSTGSTLVMIGRGLSFGTLYAAIHVGSQTYIFAKVGTGGKMIGWRWYHFCSIAGPISMLWVLMGERHLP